MLRAVVILAVEEEIAEQKRKVRVVRRKIRDKCNPLELPCTLFVKYFRVNKSAFKYLLEVLTESLSPTQKYFAVTPIVKLCASLRFFAEGGYQTGVGKDFDIGLAQSSFLEMLFEVLNVFERKLCQNWIQMQKTTAEKDATKLHFYNKFKIPGVLGCIDGTHIRIIDPPENKHLYYNRKAFYSLNVMLVCDEGMRIRYVDATHPGASHDALIWRVSELKSWMEAQYLSGEENSRLLGICLERAL